ncbi:acyl-CoA N-acyltransferase [Polychytrium aggregatum]|uniref:acyl-CoA N-acyltransferase n=1 Tax=Polychytrium aggregatum TaxID=110093 RepID=UPI0022FDB46A|nr:acyl-CoA N-acyltransferase [Polychytrium aggregatum]KAI9208931.1 acyl-CoA N-acyltransferase [Polychytrium aggregatum]
MDDFIDPSRSNPLQGWTCSSNEAVSFALVMPDDIVSGTIDESITFSPKYTYPFFGQEELIFGYKGLSIELYFTSGSLYPYFNVSYEDKITLEIAGSLCKAQELLPPLLEKWPQSSSGQLWTNDMSYFRKRVEEDAKTFRPMGTKIFEYEKDDAVYEIYHCTFDTPRFKEYHRRLQFFLLFYIEAASYIQEDDKRWDIYLLFEKVNEGGRLFYNIVGYTTCYRFVYFERCAIDRESESRGESPNTAARTRIRISQFLILPPYQENGHGKMLYTTLFSLWQSDADIADIVVEDENDGFATLRDRCDLRYLMAKNAFAGVKFPMTLHDIAEFGKPHKIGRMQAERLLELGLLKSLAPSDKASYRKQVIRRLYQYNETELSGLEPAEMKKKLNDAYSAKLEEYREVLNTI